MDILCNYCGARKQLVRKCLADGVWYCLDCQRHHVLDRHMEPEGLPELSAVELDVYALYHRHEDDDAD